jgi:hypothetical protein
MPPQSQNNGENMRKFLVNIYAYRYHAKFEVLAEDNVESIENSIVDKLGEKSINWEYLGEMNDPRVKRITYEEVINGDANTSNKPLPTEEGTGSRMGAGAS